MNKPIRTMSILCMLLFVALMVNATYLQYYKAKSLNDDPRNRRVVEAAFSRERGAILVDQEPVAKSVPSKDQFEFQRTYDEPAKYSHITGYFSFYSQTGIEQSENSVLSGDDSRLFVNRVLDMLSNEEPKGGSVELTLNRKAQDAAYDGLEALGEGVEGAAVALEPSTGRILAMVSSPSFNPNRLASHDLADVTKAYDALNTDEAQPLLNRAIQTTLPPGSTFKLVTAAAAMENKGYDADSLVPGGAVLDVPQTTHDIHNESGGSCGGERITLTRALEVSCNVSFGWLGLQLSDDEMREQAERFGFGQHYLDELSPQAVSAFPDEVDEPQRALSAIGQYDVRATPLQMAMVAAGIANGGVVMKPYLVDEILSTRPRRPAQDRSGRAVQGRLVPDRERAHEDDGGRRRQRHRHQRPDPRHPGRRQDRDGPEPGRTAALRLVRLLRPGRRPQDRGRRPRRVEQHRPQRDRRRRPVRTHRQGDDGGGDQPVTEVFADDTGRYRLDSRIATGGMGVVWRGTDTVLDRVVAIKILKGEYADDATFRSRFETEARHAAALHHPGVAAVFDSGQGQANDGGGPRPFLVMEFVDGQPLSNLLRPNAPLDPAVARTLIADAADAIGAAHAAGIVHRDVKPANLLVTPDRQIKITDFGIARAADGIALTATGQVMGTPQYLSPEQAEGSTATPASDIYSLGVVLFECLAGYRPFGGDTPITTALAHLRDPIPDLPDFVPADLAAVVRRALAKKPSERFASAADFAAALRDPAGRIAPPVVAAAPPGDADGSTWVMPSVGSADSGPDPDSDLDSPHRVPINPHAAPPGSGSCWLSSSSRLSRCSSSPS